MRVDEWHRTEFKAMNEELLNLQDELERQIELEEKYHRRIKRKLDQIAQLKENIASKLPDDNNFQQQYKQ
ncbi:hypothetical protein TRFO_18825 [Tritrichomonas foetus]|uniref:Uncharacterized protein n=1 Tax=Tritrichomonas foetus TaxID=1144522 RepID=A0A1J4KJU8_9EUKA|nr:hypothetical protein TRFO_18825 [Tritrichomonas foetus]|eukprot:OHT11583.1 hypothetical protein TRFO_18825 [Tritrichomonas foetus]